MTEHTPTPWTVWKGHALVIAGDVTENTNIGFRGKYLSDVCDCENHETPLSTSIANAEFIVRACNNFDELLTAQKELVKQLFLIDSYSMTPPRTWEILVRTMAEKAKILIANAERRPT